MVRMDFLTDMILTITEKKSLLKIRVSTEGFSGCLSAVLPANKKLGLKMLINQQGF